MGELFTDIAMGLLWTALGLALVAFYFWPSLEAGKRNNRPNTVFLVNLLTGWTAFGWLIALWLAVRTSDQPVLGPNKPRCPECRERIRPDARRCPHCRAQLEASRSAARD